MLRSSTCISKPVTTPMRDFQLVWLTTGLSAWNRKKWVAREKERIFFCQEVANISILCNYTDMLSEVSFMIFCPVILTEWYLDAHLKSYSLELVKRNETDFPRPVQILYIYYKGVFSQESYFHWGGNCLFSGFIGILCSKWCVFWAWYYFNINSPETKKKKKKA